MPNGYKNPTEYGMAYENVTLTTKDKVKLHAWFIKVNSNNVRGYRTVIFFHGNAGNIGARLPNIHLLVTRL